MTYSDEELIEELQRVSEEELDGYRPSKNDMAELGNISSQTYSNHFGTWTESIEEAGLSHKEIKGKKIDREKLVLELERISEEYCDNEAPSQLKMDKYGKYCAPTYHDRFGSWNNALKECDYEPNTILGADDKEVLAEIRRVSKEYCGGETPRQEDMINHGKWYRDIYLERFGSWSKAVEKAGFEPNTPYEYIKSGSENPLWRDSKGYGDSWKQQREKALRRDNHRCRVCLKTEAQIGCSPSVHHIKPRFYWNVKEEHEEMNSLNNLICLCMSCHGRLEEKFMESDINEFIERSRSELGIRKS